LLKPLGTRRGQDHGTGLTLHEKEAEQHEAGRHPRLVIALEFRLPVDEDDANGREDRE